MYNRASNEDELGEQNKPLRGRARCGHAPIDVNSGVNHSHIRYIKRNGVQSYLDLLESTSPSREVPCNTSSTSIESGCTWNSERHGTFDSAQLWRFYEPVSNSSMENKRLLNVREFAMELDSQFPAIGLEEESHNAKENDQSSLSSLDLHPQREPSLPNQFSPRTNENEVTTTVTVVLGEKMTRNITFNEPGPLAFEVLVRLEEILSPEDFTRCNLPTNVANIKLERKACPLQRIDEVKDGDLIYATAKLPEDIEEEASCVMRERDPKHVFKIKLKKRPLGITLTSASDCTAAYVTETSARLTYLPVNSKLLKVNGWHVEMWKIDDITDLIVNAGLPFTLTFCHPEGLYEDEFADPAPMVNTLEEKTAHEDYPKIPKFQKKSSKRRNSRTTKSVVRLGKTSSSDSSSQSHLFHDIEILFPSRKKPLPPIVHLGKNLSAKTIDCGGEELVTDACNGDDISRVAPHNAEEHMRLLNLLDDLKKANKEMKIANNKLQKDVNKILLENTVSHRKILKMKKTVNQVELEAIKQQEAHNTLLTMNEKLVDRKARLECKVRQLEEQLESVKTCDKVSVMGVTLPKEPPQDPDKLEEIIVSLHSITGKLRSLQIQSYRAQLTCAICCEKPRNSAIVPCGHCFCSTCARQIVHKCPNCRQAIERWQKIY